MLWKSLRYILSRGLPGQPESDISDTEDEESLLGGREDEWLVRRLPSLPHFSAILPKISHLLLQACLVETNLRSLLSFILFITSHVPRELIFEFSIGISQIVVDRFSIIKKVFKPLVHSGEEEKEVRRGADVMLGSLLSMLRDSLETAIQSQRMPQVSGSSDFVLVGFPSGKKTILHTALIHATLLLLTCPPPSQRSDFEFLMELWFPTGGQFPEAYTVENKEETPVVSRAILPEMLCSQNARVMGLCLRDAGVSELCASVQQFGIPVANMQQILAHLDGVCEAEHDDSLAEAVENPVELAQFTEVQLIRGVSSGKLFLAFVRKLGNLPDDPVPSVSELLADGETQEVEMVPVSPSTQDMPDFTQLSSEKVEQVLLKVFSPSASRSSLRAEEVKKHTSDIEKGLRKLIQSAASKPSGSEERVTLNTHVSNVITALHKIVIVCTARTRRQVLEGMTKQMFAISLLRLLTRIQQLQGTEDSSTTLFKATVKQISDSLGTLKTGKLKHFPRFQAVVKSCAKLLGVTVLPERESFSEKVAKVAQDCASGIKEEQNLFSKEHTMMISDICRFVGTEKQSSLVENVLSALVRRSISLGLEGECIDLLQKLDWMCRPIALHHCPEVFHQSPQWSYGEAREEKAAAPGVDEVPAKMGGSGLVSTSHPPLVSTLDMSGLKVDLLELLDPEVLRVTPEATRVEVFGYSGTASREEEEEEKEEESGGVMVATQLGPGYLMARLVHESSWHTLRRVTASLLEKECLGEG